MKVPVGWLREYVDFDLPVEELARRLVFTSCEVDRIVRRGVPDGDGNLQHFVVGKVLEAGKHPNADKLQLTKVDVGVSEPLSIVCGAWNFGAGATVAVVTPGGLMPGDLRIEKRKLRGETSEGMILSERELELGTDHGGIMVLSDELAAGTPLADVLPLGDDVLEIETLYNRPDLTSIYGIAREVAALTGATLNPIPGADPARDGDEPFSVQVEDLAACPRFIARIFRDVTLGESPAWLKARLTGAGMRPISNVVDITNYVMLSLGSPLHAYDADTLRGGIVVRRARRGEELVTLDGTRRELDPADLVIADDERAIGLAGVIGGENTEVSAATTSVVLETANFEPLTVIRSGERHRMRSEARRAGRKASTPRPQALPRVRVAAPGRARRRALDRGDRGARRTPAAAGDRLPARVRERVGRAGDLRGRAAGAARAARLRRRRGLDGADAELARARRAPRHRRRRGGGALPARGRAGDAADPAGDVRPAHARAAAAAARRGRARRRRDVRGVHVLAAAGRSGSERARAARAALVAAARPAHDARGRAARCGASTTSTWGTSDVALFESRARLPAARPRCRKSAGASAAIVQGDFFRAKGLVERVFAALNVEPRSRAQTSRTSSSVGASVQSGWVATVRATARARR